MQDSFGVNMLAIVDGRPKVLTLGRRCMHFIHHRREVVTRRTQFDLRQARERMHILEGLKIAVDNIDAVIDLIRSSKDTDAAKRGLIESFDLSARQAQAILDMRLAKLTGLEREALVQEMKEVGELIAKLEAILGSETILTKVIVEELEEVRTLYGDDRRTEIMDIDSDIDVEDMIAPEEMVVTVTHGGYVKRSPKNLYRAQKRRRPRDHRGRHPRGGLRLPAVRGQHPRHPVDVHQQGTGLRQEDLGGAGGRADRQGQGVREPDSPAGGGAGDGAAAGAGVLGRGVRGDGHPAGAPSRRPPWAPSATSGRAASSRCPSVTTSRWWACASPRGTATSCWAPGTAGPSASRRRTSARWAVPRAASGASSCATDNDQVVGMAVVPRELPVTLLTVCEKGYGKRTPTSDYPTKNRGGKGVITIKTTERNGKVVGLRIVTDDDDLMLITDGGKLIRMPVDGIPTIGRNTQGVRLIRLEEGEKVMAMERLAEKEEGEQEVSPEVAAARAEQQTLAEEDLGEEAADEDEADEDVEEEGGDDDEGGGGGAPPGAN